MLEELLIVTIESNGTPHVLLTNMSDCETVEEYRNLARDISRRNPPGTVVWILDADGDSAWYRYENGVETMVPPKYDEWPIVA